MYLVKIQPFSERIIKNINAVDYSQITEYQ